MREEIIYVKAKHQQAASSMPPTGNKPTIWTGNRTGSFLLHEMMPNQLSHCSRASAFQGLIKKKATTFYSTDRDFHHNKKFYCATGLVFTGLHLEMLE